MEVVRTPLQSCVDLLQQASGPATISDYASELSYRLASDNSGMKTCARVIECDIGLTLRLLRAANSAMVNHGERLVLNVTHAASLLGTDALASLVTAIPRTAIPRPTRELVVLSQIAGNLSWTLMARIEPRWCEEAFIAGLLRNLGEVMISQERRDDYRNMLASSGGTLTGLRAAARTALQFDFDELTAALLGAWSIRGAAALAAQSTPEALAAQPPGPENEVALAACLGHLITQAVFRAEPKDRDGILKHGLPALAQFFHVRDSHIADLCDNAFSAVEPIAKAARVTREELLLRHWISKSTDAPAPPARITAPSESTSVRGVLRSAIEQGMDRAAWLPFESGVIGLVELCGNGWPSSATSLLPAVVLPKRPPFLLAFGQRQDVWIDMVKDDRFAQTDFARKLDPKAFLLLPVSQGRTVRGCLYFDWTTVRDRPADSMLPQLAALRDQISI